MTLNPGKTPEKDSPISFYDLKAINDPLWPEFNQAFEKFYQRNNYILGPEVEGFETEFAQYCGAEYCVGLSNGLDALKIILHTLKIGPGDEVVVPANSFIASALCISAVGATPVFADVDAKTYNLSLETVEKVFTTKTKAIIHVHLYGQMTGLREISEFCRNKNIYLIEDAAQAHGAEQEGKRAGNHGVAAGFSFYPGKGLGAFGDAGALVTNDDNIYQAAKKYRNYGSDIKYVHDYPGENCRLDELQAAFLRIKLKKMNQWAQQKVEIASYYLENLKRELFEINLESKPEHHSWHIFPVLCSEKRESIQQKLKEVGIQTLIHYPISIPQQRVYASMGHSLGDFPVSEGLCERVLSLPIWPGLDYQEVVRRINSLG